MPDNEKMEREADNLEIWGMKKAGEEEKGKKSEWNDGRGNGTPGNQVKDNHPGKTQEKKGRVPPALAFGRDESMGCFVHQSD